MGTFNHDKAQAGLNFLITIGLILQACTKESIEIENFDPDQKCPCAGTKTESVVIWHCCCHIEKVNEIISFAYKED